MRRCWSQRKGCAVIDVFKKTALAAILALAGAGVGYAQSVEDVSAAAAAPWCQLDDPASWRLEREKLIAQNIRDLDNIPCPKRSAGGVKPVELTLPMPCGRSMMFRRIDVPVEHALDQIVGHFGRSVDVTAETAQTVLSDGPWLASVAGAFSLTEAGSEATSDRCKPRPV